MVAAQALTFAPTIVIDTSGASNSLKRGTARQVGPYLSEPHRPVHSFQTEQELITWSQSRYLTPRRAAGVRDYVARATFIDSDREIDRICAEIVRGRLDRGEERNTEDAWTCAVAAALGVPVLTYDRSGFSDVAGLEAIVLAAPTG